MLGNNRRRRVPIEVLRRQMELRRRAARLNAERQLAEQQAEQAQAEQARKAQAEQAQAEQAQAEQAQAEQARKAQSQQQVQQLELQVEEKKVKPKVVDRVNMEEIMNSFKLFWQYPVITEKTFYLQNKDKDNFIGLPWATMRDKKYNLELMYKIIKPYVKFKNYYTCCQHIDFKVFINLWKSLGITKVYTVHKSKGEDNINGVEILPCPLYAVNFEDKSRNKKFIGVNYFSKERPLLYSFIGAYNPHCYITDIRERIYEMKHPKNCLVEKTNSWHFEKMVYSKMQNSKGELNENEKQRLKGEKYNEVLLNSRYTLCPSGSGPNSIRLWEALACGSIPVLLADTLELPKHELWKDTIVEVKEKDLLKLPEILGEIGNEKEMRKNCLELYKYFKDNYRNSYDEVVLVTPLVKKEVNRKIVHYCCGGYHVGDYGGVARFDYHISLAFKDRKFFRGPQEKEKLLAYLKENSDALVITDNHLACDIPNKYEMILVHHGVAQTHAEREPGWHAYWKKLCCEGQAKMLYHRDPKMTKILSISDFCTEEFTKYYKEDYTCFKSIKLLHTSELNENRFKTIWNNEPRVLGNWKDINKGMNTVSRLSKKGKYKFEDLRVSCNKGDISDFNRRKQDIYLKNDIFLQLSLCEGNSYSTLDALLCGIPVVSSNVGLFYKDVPEDCFVKIDWKRNNDLEYVESKLKYAWENREKIGRKGREWYLKNCRFEDWKNQIRNIINEL